ncbi:MULTISPECIES: TetR/AcrR family transcriptional regulator [unclassified Bacillus (in: firmicutes)]|uniref:TetR/AcrR family transcriptional regulator n=1 Tax=unclassified Bacillus (in: firmicutes) TaxID=185979 RepID=UPI0008EF1597|nr:MULTISPECIES: TetR/AcrR family transcriptional regulator [unclassified Bacillus (in: firmicutes)]SFJ04882.1 DNA-binding transcriptional regulator, AcrR family [Bacillus sp. 71mf]SFS68270.1 DNA-binding transcriptional regulator, AcrR family [Bacillus sp. 103mf]
MAIDRKRAIIEAATKSFSAFGYKATTMDQVAKLANVGKGTIYTFFKNKEELFGEIISNLITEMKQVAEMTIDSNEPFFENVHRALYSILEFRKDHQLMIKLIQEERDMGTKEVQDVMRQLDSTIITFIKSRLEDAIAKGEIMECDPEITAFIMVRLYISLIFDWEKHHEPLEKEHIAELFELYLLKGLSK